MMTLLITVLLVMAALALLSAFIAWLAQRAVPPLGTFVEVEGHRLHYLDVGQGPTLLLIHGLGGQMRNFTYALVDQLKSRYRVVVVERPGSGYSKRASGSSAALQDQARVMGAFMTALGIQAPIVVGHSLGGALALTMGLEFGERLRGLALIAPLTHKPESAPAVFRMAQIQSTVLRALAAWTTAIPWMIARNRPNMEQVFGPERIPRDFPLRGGGLLILRPTAFANVSKDLVAVEASLPAVSARYATLRLPIAVLYGTGDRILDPVAQGRGLRAVVQHVQLTETEGGHMLPVTQPERTAAWLDAWVATLPV